jgi:hypothetical protein
MHFNGRIELWRNRNNAGRLMRWQQRGQFDGRQRMLMRWWWEGCTRARAGRADRWGGWYFGHNYGIFEPIKIWTKTLHALFRKHAGTTGQNHEKNADAIGLRSKINGIDDNDSDRDKHKHDRVYHQPKGSVFVPATERNEAHDCHE